MIAASYKGPAPCAALIESCARLGVPLHMLYPQPEASFASNDLELMRRAFADIPASLEAETAEYVVVTDAFDVLAVRWAEDGVIGRIEAARGHLIISAEANCFPEGPWRAVYDSDSQLPWRYANGGQCCGRRREVLTLWRIFAQRIAECGTGGTQTLLHKLYCEGYPMQLDRECRVFQSMYLQPHFVKLHQGMVRNSRTGSAPMFLHFNGQAPGMAEWAAKLK